MLSCTTSAPQWVEACRLTELADSDFKINVFNFDRVYFYF